MPEPIASRISAMTLLSGYLYKWAEAVTSTSSPSMSLAKPRSVPRHARRYRDLQPLCRVAAGADRRLSRVCERRDKWFLSVAGELVSVTPDELAKFKANN